MRLIIISILLAIILGMLVVILGCDDYSKTYNLTGTEDTTIVDESGEGDVEIGCCDEKEDDYSRCWSTCQSKNELDPEECAACERGERDCVWPWEIDRECLQE